MAPDRRIYKYPIDLPVTPLHIPVDAVVLHVGLDPSGESCVWVNQDINSPNVYRDFYILGTGQSIPDGLKYVGTYKEGAFVWHVWEDIDGIKQTTHNQ